MTDDTENGSSKSPLDWLYRQGVSTVLLGAILWAIYHMGYYAMDTAIPRHLKSIQDGYERIEASHARSLERLSQAIEKRQTDR